MAVATSEELTDTGGPRLETLILNSRDCFHFSSQWNLMNKNLFSPLGEGWRKRQETWGLALERMVRRQVVDGKHKEAW